ncbi:MAG: hypothetical protein V4508_02305 [Pseudomonadota bacterium]
MEIEQRIYNGDQARLVLENEAFAAAFADMRQEIIDQWKNAPARDHEGREKLWQLLKLTDKLESTLRAAMDTGKMAKFDLKHKQSWADRAKSAIGMA